MKTNTGTEEPKFIESFKDTIISSGNESLIILFTALITWISQQIRLRSKTKVPKAVKRLKTYYRQLDMVLSYLLGLAGGEKVELAVCHNCNTKSGVVDYDRYTWFSTVVADNFDNLLERLHTELNTSLPKGVELNKWVLHRGKLWYLISTNGVNPIAIIRLTRTETTDLTYLIDQSGYVVDQITQIILATQE